MSEYFGLGRQSYYDRQKAKHIPYDELKRAFPGINTEWLYSDDINELKGMPVRNHKAKSDIYEEKFLQIRAQTSGEGMPSSALDLLLEALEEESKKILSDMLRLTNQIQRVRQLKKSDENRGDDQA